MGAKFCRLCVCVAAITLMAGCGEKSVADGRGPELVILVGNSFIPPTERLIAEFETQTDRKSVV